MSVEQVLFYVFGAIAVLSALSVITLKNVVHSAVALAATLLSVAGIFLTLRAEFLAGVQVIVYVGGILVLFIFVIMLISIEKSIVERQFNRQWVVALITALLLIGELGFVVWRGKDSLVVAEGTQPQASVLGVTGNTQLVGETLYGQYLLPFEIASILLLVAIVGSVALAKRKTQAE
ncbi:MAG TPA: NADH-quinone oxidoreductase subunit J [Terriglobia bacterium]|nr:NADH-quinone oxidoreductase subunit J [Terriglobia bacterium]